MPWKAYECTGPPSYFIAMTILTPKPAYSKLNLLHPCGPDPRAGQLGKTAQWGSLQAGGKFWPHDVLSFLRSWFGSTPIRGFLDLWYQGCAISRMKQKKSNPNMCVDLHSMLAGLHQATRFV